MSDAPSQFTLRDAIEINAKRGLAMLERECAGYRNQADGQFTEEDDAIREHGGNA